MFDQSRWTCLNSLLWWTRFYVHQRVLINDASYRKQTINSPVTFTVGHGIVDMQVMAALATLAAVVVHVTLSLLRSVASTLPLFSIVSEMLRLGHTRDAEHVYVTLSPAPADSLSTVQFGVVATKHRIVPKKLFSCICKLRKYTVYFTHCI